MHLAKLQFFFFTELETVILGSRNKLASYIKKERFCNLHKKLKLGVE